MTVLAVIQFDDVDQYETVDQPDQHPDGLTLILVAFRHEKKSLPIITYVAVTTNRLAREGQTSDAVLLSLWTGFNTRDNMHEMLWHMMNTIVCVYLYGNDRCDWQGNSEHPQPDLLELATESILKCKPSKPSADRWVEPLPEFQQHPISNFHQFMFEVPNAQNNTKEEGKPNSPGSSVLFGQFPDTFPHSHTETESSISDVSHRTVDISKSRNDETDTITPRRRPSWDQYETTTTPMTPASHRGSLFDPRHEATDTKFQNVTEDPPTPRDTSRRESSSSINFSHLAESIHKGRQ